MRNTLILALSALLPAVVFGNAASQNSVLLTFGMITLVPFLIPFFTILLINGFKKIWKQKLSTIRKRYIIYSGWIGALLVIIVFAIYGKPDFPWYILYGASVPFSLIGYLISILKGEEEPEESDRVR